MRSMPTLPLINRSFLRNLRYDMTQKIEAVSIPPQAKIKDFFIQWY
jgi:hypothetical protein